MGIGTTAPVQNLDVGGGNIACNQIFAGNSTTGNARINIRDYVNNFIAFHVFTNNVGSITYTGSATSYNTASDRRLKSNIVSITTEQSGPIIDALNPRSFNWSSDGKADVGFIADEVQEVIPDAVHGEANAVDESGNPIYQMVDMSQPKLIAYLVAEIQSLRSRVTVLEKK